MIRLLVSGSRNWGNLNFIFAMLGKFCIQIGKPDVVIVGGAAGADSIAERWARIPHIPVEKYLPDWDKDGKGAGYKRNQRMLEEGKPSHGLFFRRGGAERSPGTTDMFYRARKAKVICWAPFEYENIKKGGK